MEKQNKIEPYLRSIIGLSIFLIGILLYTFKDDGLVSLLLIGFGLSFGLTALPKRKK